MKFIPWRVRNSFSDRFPLLYHVIANFGIEGNSAEKWDERLKATWDSTAWQWPTKNDLIASMTRPSEVILDVGCGTGSLLQFLQRLGYCELHGLEISRYAVQRLSEAGIRMHLGSLLSATLPVAQFDVVIASQVLEHVIRRHRFLKTLRRLLKPGGRALIFVPDDCLGPIDEPAHVIKYTATSLRQLLHQHFHNVSVRTIRDVNHPMPVLFAVAS